MASARAAPERVRLVVLGGQGVGKSSIVKRFLFNMYSDKYKSTVEDLYTKEYVLSSGSITIDVLDTAGDQQFPAMRRLSIGTAHAFVLVYACTSDLSFQTLKLCMNEIKEQRSDYQKIPIVIAGNKYDLVSSHREVAVEDVSEWLNCDHPDLRAQILECSARDDVNIKDLFRVLYSLSKDPQPEGVGPSVGLKHPSTAYVASQAERTSSPAARGMLAAVAGPSTDVARGLGLTSLGSPKAKPRSRSLIRRCSRKSKTKDDEACNVS